MLFRITAGLFAAFMAVSSVQAQPAAKGRVDALGDPLPAGAIARLGTLRMRQAASHICFLPDGKKAIVQSGSDSQAIKVWELATGKELHRLGSEEKGVFTQLVLSGDGNVLASIGRRSIQLWSPETGKKLAEFAGESSGFSYVFKDNKALLGIDRHGWVEHWDLGKGERVLAWNCLANFIQPKEIDEPLNNICDAAFSPDAGMLVAQLGHKSAQMPKDHSASKPGRIVVAWDTKTAKELWRKVGDDTGNQFVFSRDCKWLAQFVAWKRPGEILFCEAATGKVHSRLPLDKIALPTEIGKGGGGKGGLVALGGVFLRAVAPDGKMVAIGRQDSGLFLWDTSENQRLKEVALLSGPSHWDVPVVEFSPDGKKILVESEGLLQHIELSSGKQLLSLDGHYDAVRTLSFSADGLDVTTGNDRRQYDNALLTEQVLTWAIPSGKLVRRSGAEEALKSHRLLAASDDLAIGLIEMKDGAYFLALESGKKLGKFKAWTKEKGLPLCMFSPTGRHFIVIQWPIGDLLIFDSNTGNEVLKIRCDKPFSFAFSPDETRFAVQEWQGAIVIASTATGKVLSKLSNRVSDVPRKRGYPLAFSPNGKILASWDVGLNVLVMWNLATGKDLQFIPGRETDSQVITLCWSPDSRMLAETGLFDGHAVRIWEGNTGKLRREFTGHRGEVHDLAFSPNSRLLASGSADTTVLIWDLLAN